MDLETFKLSIILGFSVVLLHFSLLKKDEKSSVGAVVFIFIGSFLFIVMLSYLVSLYEKSDSKEKIEAFYNGKTVVCKAGALGIKQNYLVLEKEGWSVYEEEFFKKDDLLLEIINCEVKK
ncbi:hypothetical protein [Sulfurimonas sp.]|uniref:hypothetical protein n=1 Tax=Sulfurimonas sp. TaxID=2022749 RepID=UPI00286DE2E5|nr:hypothetical protein [Sulfurimonas sp.]